MSIPLIHSRLTGNLGCLVYTNSSLIEYLDALTECEDYLEMLVEFEIANTFYVRKSRLMRVVHLSSSLLSVVHEWVWSP